MFIMDIVYVDICVYVFGTSHRRETHSNTTGTGTRARERSMLYLVQYSNKVNFSYGV
jgi:hypothetical protein